MQVRRALPRIVIDAIIRPTRVARIGESTDLACGRLRMSPHLHELWRNQRESLDPTERESTDAPRIGPAGKSP